MTSTEQPSRGAAAEPAAAGRHGAGAFSVERGFGVSCALNQLCGLSFVRLNGHPFLLDVSRGRIDLAKVKLQNRGRQVVVLVRLDLGGAPHRNPDGEEIATPHLHVYREGYGDKWARPVPTGRFRDLADLWATLEDFLGYCNVTQPPHIEPGLFL